MKKCLILLMSLLALLPVSNVLAQQKKATYIYRNDNAFDAFACSDIDSITYEGDGNNATQVIWAKDGITRIPVSAIDSVSFSVPQKVLLQIAEEDLNGWEFGYSLGDEYVVAYHEESDNTLVMMKNKNGANAEDGLVICFNEHNEIIRAGKLGKVYDVRYEDNNIIMYRINEDGLYEQEVIPVNQSAQPRRSPMRAVSINDIIKLITNGINFVSNVAQGGTVATDMHNWKWDWDTVSDIGWLLIGIGAGGIPGAIITIGKGVFDHYDNQQNEQKRAVLYGDCTISIDEIRPDNSNSVTYVYATVRNANTLPDYVFRVMYDHVCNDETRNLVSCGIVVRAHNEYVTTHINDYKSQTTQLNGDVKYGTEANLVFTIPGLDLTNSLSTYYFRPYLTSTRLESNYGDVKEGYIKYGETVPYTAFNGEIKEFKQYYAQYSTDADNYGFVMFNTTVNATINNLDNLEEWGVYVYDLNGSGVYDYYPSEFRAAKLEDWIDIDFNINKGEFDELNDEYFLATKKVKMGVYQKLKNPTGNYDYMTYFHSEPQEYELVYDEKPGLTFTSASLGGTEVYNDDDGEPYYCSTHVIAEYTAKGTFWVNKADLVVIQGNAEDNVGYWDVMNDGDQTFAAYYNYPYGGDHLCAFRFDFVLSNGNRVSSTNAVQISGSPIVTNISIISANAPSAEPYNAPAMKSYGKLGFKPIFVLKKE